MTRISLKFLFICATLAVVPTLAAPVDLPEYHAPTRTCDFQTLQDGSILSLCKDTRSAELVFTNGSSDPVVLTSAEVTFPTAFKMITGYVCSIVLHNNAYGQKCFDSAESVGLAALMPGEGNALPSSTFSQTVSNSLVIGQPGTCFEGTDRLSFSGLTPQAQLLAIAARNGKIMECDLTEFTPRLFMSAMWNGLTVILPVLIAIGVALLFMVGILPYALLGACCTASR